MPDVNPYAYTEEPDFVFSRQQGSQTGEPALPLNMSLVHKTGVFSSCPCQMSVTEDQIEISGMHLEEPVTIRRLTARDQVKLRLLDMKIRDDNGRKYRMKYPKTDPEKYLTLARLETWLNPDMTDNPEAARQRVDNRLKKWTCSMVSNWITGLLALQIIGTIALAIVWVVFVSGDESEVDEVPVRIASLALIVGVVVLLVVPNITFLLLLRSGQMWVLYFIILFYALFGLLGLLVFRLIEIMIGATLIYYSVKAVSDYKRLSPQIGGIME